MNIPMTAHFIGGCPIGESARRRLDPYHRMYGYEGLYVVDGSTLTANLGVNPALSITAQAERALSMWPNHGTADIRPPVGSPYRRVAGLPGQADRPERCAGRAVLRQPGPGRDCTLEPDQAQPPRPAAGTDAKPA